MAEKTNKTPGFLKGIFCRIADYIAQYSPSYKQRGEQITQMSSELDYSRVGEASALRELDEVRSSRNQLSDENSELVNKLARTNSNYEQTCGELEQLKADYASIRSQIPQIRTLVRQALASCSDIKNSKEGMIESVKAWGTTNQALREWESGTQKILEGKLASAQEQVKYANRRAQILEGVAASVAVQLAIGDERKQQIPFVYYGFATKDVVYTPAACTLLGADENVTRLGIRGLLKYLQKNDSHGRNTRAGILESLRTGDPLAHYQVLTKTGKEMQISTRPFIDENGNSVGVGILLDDPLISLEIITRKKHKMLKSIQDRIIAIQEGFVRIVKDKIGPEPAINS